MKALEHEYKGMGLAVYSKPAHCTATYDLVFRDVARLKTDGSLKFDSRFPLNRFEVHVRRTAVGERFDNLAGALQMFTEMLVLEWVRAANAETGIRNVVTSGGVFMNVKLNKLIPELPKVERVHFMPSCGDESNPFGAAFYTSAKAEVKPEALTESYLGHSYTNDEVRSFIESQRLADESGVEFADGIEDKVAGLLADFHVVARAAGGAEFRYPLAETLDNALFTMRNSGLRHLAARTA